MPSPFPGMDPYLEDPATWLGLRLSFLAAVQDQLAPLLSPRYYINFASHDQQVDLADPAYTLVTAGMRPPAGGLPPVGLADRWLEIRRPPRGPMVTAVELLTPGGKVAGSVLQRAVQDRRTAATAVGANWVGIDLLRGGTPVQTSPMLPRSDYLAVADLSSREQNALHAWPLRLTERLPIIAVPLALADGDVPLDLQRAVDHVQRVSGHEFFCDYAADPPPPAMSADALAWCRATIGATRG